MRNQRINICVILILFSMVACQRDLGRFESNLDYEQTIDTLIFNAKRQIPRDAILSAVQAKDLAHQNKLGRKEGLAYEVMGVVYRQMGDYVNAVDASFTALKIYDSLGLYDYKASLELQIGSHLANSQDYQQAVPLFESALQYFLRNDDNINICRTYINLGETYRLLGELSQAAKSFRACLARCEDKKYTRIKSYAVGNLGLVHFEQNSMHRAKSELIESIEQLSSSRDAYSIAIFKSKLGQIYIREGDFVAGEVVMKEAYKFANDLGLKEQIRDISFDLSIIYEKTGHLDNALLYFRKYKQASDSLINIQKVRDIAAIQKSYELDQKESAIHLLQKENINKKRQLKRLAFGVLLLLVMFVFMISEYHKRKKAIEALKHKNILIHKRESEKELLLRELNHRVKNNLQMVSSMFNIQARQVQDEQARLALNSARLRVDALTLIHQTLYRKDVDTHINLSTYVNELSKSLVYNLSQDRELQLDLDDIYLSIDSAIPLGIILNELLTNALKYSGSGLIRIGLTSQSENVELHISDEGPGMKDDFETMTKSSLGLKLVSSLIRQLSGTIEQYNDNGCHWLVKFNLSELKK